MIDQQEIKQYAIQNTNGMVLKVINYGATITDIIVPDREGNFENVVLSFDSPERYLRPENPYFGATIGRFANRIAKAEFTLDGVLYSLSKNNFGNTLHGGFKGFDKVIWETELLDKASILMRYHSYDGEEGYPGNLLVEVIFSLSDDNSLSIQYKARTDKSTPVSLTNHSYFNLSAGKKEHILDHELMIKSVSILAVDDLLIPTGEIQDITEGPFDFREIKGIGRDIAATTVGYDHNFILNSTLNEPAAILFDPHSGRVMELYTDQPGLQFYSGNFLDGSLHGQSGRVYGRHAGLCLEPQQFPDAPNQGSFPNTLLKPGEYYRQLSIYKFSVR